MALASAQFSLPTESLLGAKKPSHQIQAQTNILAPFLSEGQKSTRSNAFCSLFIQGVIAGKVIVGLVVVVVIVAAVLVVMV